jgi:uncharacterized membrane protein
MASSAPPEKTTPRTSSTKALFDEVIVPTAVNAAGEVGAAVDRVAAYSRKSPGPALAASLVLGTALGWLLGRPKQPPETWVQNKTRRLAEAAKSVGYPLNARQLAALQKASRSSWLGGR